MSASPPGELADYFGAIAPSQEAYHDGEDGSEDGGAPRPGANFNVAPTSEVFVVYEREATRRLERFTWGLVPSWAKDPSIGNKLANARSETVTTKNAFRKAVSRRRCIIPADGFYEWTKVPGHRKKQPWYIYRPDGEPMAFAGLWELWRPGLPAGPARAGHAAGESPLLASCTILTTSANDKLAELHDRMPVLLAPSAWDRWLDRTVVDADSILDLLVPAPSQLIAFYPVSTEVNNARNQGPQLREAIAVIDPDGKGDLAELRLDI